MYKKFKSLMHAEDFGYAYDSEAYDHKAPVESHFRSFQNYGDGLTAHSADWSVTFEQLDDYLISLAVAMLEDEDLLQHVSYRLLMGPKDEEIAFAAGVRYKDATDRHTNRRWVSVKEMKLSASESKRHDRRYEEVQSWADGSFNAIFRLLMPEFISGLHSYCYAHAIREWALKQKDGPWTELPAEFLKWFKDDKASRDKARNLRDSFESCRNVIEAYRLRHAAQNSIDNRKRSVEREETAPSFDGVGTASEDKAVEEAAAPIADASKPTLAE